MKKLLLMLFCVILIAGCSHSETTTTTETTPAAKKREPEIIKNFVVKYKIIDSTECSGGRDKGEFYLSISEEYSTNSEAEIHDINPSKHEYRTSGRFVTTYIFSNYKKKQYTVTLLDKNLFNNFVKKTGKFVGTFFKFPVELLDDYLDEYQFCAKSVISSSEIISGEKKFYMKNAAGKTKVVIYASGD